MKNKFDFYEVVKVSTKIKKLSKLNNCLAVVIGMVQDSDEKWIYAITVYFGDFGDIKNSDGWDVYEDVLQPTGKFMKREDFYDGSVAKVVVDEDGGGHLKDLHLKDNQSSTEDV